MNLRRILIEVLVLGSAVAAFPTLAQDVVPHPTCNHCQAVYVPNSELEAYKQRAIEHHLVDLQVRSVDLGRMQVGIGSIYRGKLGQNQGPQNQLAEAVAEHDQVSEVYYIVEGSATLLTGPDLVDPKPRPRTLRAVREQNGPGFSAASIKNPEVHELDAGDMIVIPAGTGHWFTKIDDHIRYVMVRLDPDKILPTKNEEQSMKYLASRYSPDQGNF